MKMELEIFGRLHKYYFDYGMKTDIRVMQELSQKIKEQQILTYSMIDPVHIYIEDDEYICNDCISWIYKQQKDIQKEESFTDCLLKCSVEDKELAEQRNKEFTETFYHYITFLPEIQKMTIEKLNEYIFSLDQMCKKYAEEEHNKKVEFNKQKSQWKITKTYKSIYPKGGENGVDGYIDAEYISENGETIRMVNRDIFDFGCYSYPKRLEGTKDIFNRELWNESEKQLSIWLSKFGEFHRIRM